jgi:oligo-1,6-glucosidase
VDLKANLAKWQYGLSERGWNSLYWNNHDQPRVVSRYGDDGAFWYESATLLATVLHLHRGTPFVYQGEELGMTNYPFREIDEFQDVEALNHYRQAVEQQGQDPRLALLALTAMGRDNARTPMQWDDGEHAGFTTGTPWLAVNPNSRTVNAAAEVADQESVFHYYRRLIALRHQDPVVRDGDFELLLPDDPSIYAFTRTAGTARLLVVANFTGEPVAVPLELGGEPVIGNYREPHGSTLRPWEVRVVRMRVG